MRNAGLMSSLLLLLPPLCSIAPPAAAITITGTQDINSLTTALLGGTSTGVIITGTFFSGHRQDSIFAPGSFETSSGTFTNTSGTYGIGPGIVLSTGAVEERTYFDADAETNVTLSGYGDGPNRLDDNSTEFYTMVPFQFGIPATTAQEALLDPITAVGTDTFDHFDVTDLVINFDMQPGFDSVRFNVVFGSEEYPEFVPVGFFDGFGMFLNGSNVAFVDGQPVNIRHPSMAAVSGTELDGVLAPGGNPLLVFGGAVNPAGNSLRFIIGDREDAILDSTVYISSLEGVPPVPLPGTFWLLGTAAAFLGIRYRSRR